LRTLTSKLSSSLDRQFSFGYVSLFLTGISDISMCRVFKR
jgi:hypothetical protein